MLHFITSKICFFSCKSDLKLLSFLIKIYIFKIQDKGHTNVKSVRKHLSINIILLSTNDYTVAKSLFSVSSASNAFPTQDLTVSIWTIVTPTVNLTENNSARPFFQKPSVKYKLYIFKHEFITNLKKSWSRAITRGKIPYIMIHNFVLCIINNHN